VPRDSISKYDDNFIRFDDSRIEIMKSIQGDTDENSMLWFPWQKTLIAGDIVFNGMHVYTAETDMSASTMVKFSEHHPRVETCCCYSWT